MFFWSTVYVANKYTRCPHEKMPLIFSPWRLHILTDFHNFFVHNFTRECQSHWRKNFLPYIRYVAPIPCESLRHKSNTFHTILALCAGLYLPHLRIPVSMKQTKHSRKSKLKIDVENVHNSREHMHLNDYSTAQSLPRWWCGPAASTPSADVLSTPSHHGISLAGYPRCCSPSDSNLANWMATSMKG